MSASHGSRCGRKTTRRNDRNPPWSGGVIPDPKKTGSLIFTRDGRFDRPITGTGAGAVITSIGVCTMDLYARIREAVEFARDAAHDAANETSDFESATIDRLRGDEFDDLLTALDRVSIVEVEGAQG